MPVQSAVRFAPFIVVSVVHLVTLMVPFEAAQSPTKALLMPTLAEGFWALSREERPDRADSPVWPRLVLVALVFSWLGDLALTGGGDARFLAGVGFFLVAQVMYIVMFRRLGRDAGSTSPRWLVVPYVAWWVGFLALFLAATGPDPLLFAVALYGVALGVMAYSATRVSLMTAIGAASFLVSDSLIGLSGFAEVTLPMHDVWVMLTYTVGQGLIVAGLVRATRSVQSVK